MKVDIMTINPFANFHARKRQKALETALVCPVRFPASRKSSAVMRALAKLGIGLGGVSAGDDEHMHGIG